jgi:hypothetical protein
VKPFKAGNYYGMGRLIENLATANGATWEVGKNLTYQISSNPKLDKVIPGGELKRTSVYIWLLRDLCNSIGVQRSTQYADDIGASLNPKRKLTYKMLGLLLRELDKHVRWDLEKELFMHIPSSRSEYYQNRKLLSRQSVTNFPSSVEEITEAGNCYAANCYTASVLHSMRSLEKPIHALGIKLNITLPKAIEVSQWGEIHREINNKVTALRMTPLTPARDEEIAFYSGLNLEFGYFNDVWRRFVAHARKSYDQPQALSAMQHVIAFIDKASADGLKELP